MRGGIKEDMEAPRQGGMGKSSSTPRRPGPPIGNKGEGTRLVKCPTRPGRTEKVKGKGGRSLLSDSLRGYGL